MLYDHLCVGNGNITHQLELSYAPIDHLYKQLRECVIDQWRPTCHQLRTHQWVVKLPQSCKKCFHDALNYHAPWRFNPYTIILILSFSLARGMATALQVWLTCLNHELLLIVVRGPSTWYSYWISNAISGVVNFWSFPWAIPLTLDGFWYYGSLLRIISCGRSRHDGRMDRKYISQTYLKFKLA